MTGKEQFLEAEAWLYARPRWSAAGTAAYKPGLDRIRALLNALGNPHHAYPSILVAGTNGKGTTASMIASAFTASGSRAGLHTSPHLLFIGERMRVDGIGADEVWLTHAVSRFKGVFDEIDASFFEVGVALSLLFFAEKEVDVAVVEVGLGGRLDATNALEPVLSVITGIALDHTGILGDSLEEIAREKAGIMRADRPVLTAATQPHIMDVLAETADRVGAEFHLLSAEVDMLPSITEPENDQVFAVQTLRTLYDPVFLDLPGEHHRMHAALCIRACEMLYDIKRMAPGAILAGIAGVRALSGLRGRMEQIRMSPDTWIDVSHNPQALEAALRWHAETRSRRPHVLIGMQRDKALSEVGRLLSAYAASVTVCAMEGERAASVAELSTVFALEGATVVGSADSVREALKLISDTIEDNETIFVTGSHIIAAEAIRVIEAGDFSNKMHSGQNLDANSE